MNKHTLLAVDAKASQSTLFYVGLVSLMLHKAVSHAMEFVTVKLSAGGICATNVFHDIYSAHSYYYDSRFDYVLMMVSCLPPESM